MSNITGEWVSEGYGEHVLAVRKKQGMISQKELAEFLCKAREYGLFINMIDVNDSVCSSGESDCENLKGKGDEVYLYRYVQDEPCPVCGKMATLIHPIDPPCDYDESAKIIRNSIESHRPIYQLSCTYYMEDYGGMCLCGVADSIEGIMQLMHEHVHTLLFLEDWDPFFQIPAPSNLPATIEYEWDDAKVNVIYSISSLSVLCDEKRYWNPNCNWKGRP